MTKQLTPETDYGQFRCGEKNRNAKLTEIKVMMVKRLLAFGYTQRVIAGEFEVSKQTISNINTKKTWRWLE